MSKLEWDKTGERQYEVGVDHGVIYPYDSESSAYAAGEAWNGLISVSESPEGADLTDFWADNIKYASMRAAENYKSTIECYTYPEGFKACNGEASLGTGVTIGQQARKSFCFSYRTKIGNDTDGSDHGYKIHLVYGCTAAPSERQYGTVNDSPDAITFSYEIDATPVNVTGHKPTALLTIDSTKTQPAALAEIEKKLYGDTSTEPTILTPDEIAAILTQNNS